MSGERSDEDEFVQLAGACLRRFVSQNGRRELPAGTVEAVCRGVWKTAMSEGFPKPLAAGEQGVAGEMPVAEVNRLMADAMARVSWPVESGDHGTPVRQLLKACLQPEFRTCRESYREVINGKCRRQELERVRERISGSHCVDCPHWDEFSTSADHEAFLRGRWVGDPCGLDQGREVFLPEDFRDLRRFLQKTRNKLKACEPGSPETDMGIRNAT